MLDNKIITGLEIKTAKDKDNKPLSFGDWLKLNFDEEKLRIIVDDIMDEIEKIKDEREEQEKKIKKYRNAYNQIVAQTNQPFKNAFNLPVPLTVKNVDTSVAQTLEAFEDVDPKWAIAAPPDKNLMPMRDIQEKTLDYYSDTEMEDVDAWEKVYHDAFLLGNGWLAMVFKRDFLPVRDFREYDNLNDFMNDYPDDYHKYPNYVNKLSQGEKIKIIVEYKQEVCRSAKPEHVEWEDVYVPLVTGGVEGMFKAHIIARRRWMRYWEIKQLEEIGDFNKVSDKLMFDVIPLTNDIDYEKLIDYNKKEYEVFEVIYFVEIDGVQTRCLFNIEVDRRICLRDIRYPYNHNRPYIIPYYIQNTKKGIYQSGLGEKLLYLNIAGNALINHVLNAAIIANSLSLKVRSGTDAVTAMYEHEWYPGSILELMNIDDVQQFVFGTPNLSSLINLFAIIEKFGQDVSGIVNYMSGQESGEDPEAPASKTFALMRKSEGKLRRHINRLKISNNEAGYQALKLTYQYVPKKRIAQVLGITENEVKALNYPLKLNAQAAGFAIEKIFEKRDNMQWFNILIKDPLFMNNDKLRVTLYEVLAKDYGSNWDKKLAQIISVDKIEEMKQLEMLHQKKAEIIQTVVKKMMEDGASEEEAKEAGINAGRNYEAMMGGGSGSL